MSADELRDLAQTLLATDQFPTSWVWNAAEDHGQPEAYVDCSCGRDGLWTLEVGDGEDVAQLKVSATDLADIHKQLTVQLMVVQMQREQVDTAGRAAAEATALEMADDDTDGM